MHEVQARRQAMEPRRLEAEEAGADAAAPMQRRRRRRRKPRTDTEGPIDRRPNEQERRPNEQLTPLAVQKRTNAMRRCMDEPVTAMYFEMCKRSGQTPMLGPDPADPRISKRQWERSFRRFATHVVWGDLERPQAAAEGSAAGSQAAMDGNAKKAAEAATKALVMRGAVLRKVDDAPLR